MSVLSKFKYFCFKLLAFCHMASHLIKVLYVKNNLAICCQAQAAPNHGWNTARLGNGGYC